MHATVELKDVCLANEDGEPVFEHLDLELNAGEKVLIIGPVACGKSVLVKLLAGTVKPDLGTVRVFGTATSGLEDRDLNPLRKRMGFVTKGNILISNLKAVENVALPLLYHSDLSYEESMRRAYDLLVRCGFEGDPWQQSGPLSQHIKKGIAVARALVMDPELVVCESISEGLRKAELERIIGLLVEYYEKDPHRTLLFTSKDDYGASYMKPDRILRLEGYRLLG